MYVYPIKANISPLFASVSEILNEDLEYSIHLCESIITGNTINQTEKISYSEKYFVYYRHMKSKILCRDDIFLHYNVYKTCFLKIKQLGLTLILNR
jgi:hypothetical protein